MSEEEKRSFLERIKTAFGDYVYGMASHDMTRQALKTRAAWNTCLS